MIELEEHLLAAASSGDCEQVERALQAGAAVDTANAFGSTPLICAAISGATDVAGLLVAKGADLEHRAGYGISALHQAVSHEQNPAMVKLLLDAGSNVDGTMENGTTALMIAASRGNIEIVRMLLDHGADPDKRDDCGWNAWHCAVEKNESDSEVATILLLAGATKEILAL